MKKKMNKKWIVIAVFAGLALYAAKKVYADQKEMTPQQAAMQQAQMQQRQMQQSILNFPSRKMTFVNNTSNEYWLDTTFKGKGNCKKETTLISPQGSGTSEYIIEAKESCCLTDFKLTYIAQNANQTNQIFYSQPNLNNGNGICEDKTFTIVWDSSARYGIRVDW